MNGFDDNGTTNSEKIKLPGPKFDGDFSVEKAIMKRRSIRDFCGDSLTLQEISQLLWAAQGITGDEGLRTTPSAGALFPLEIYLVVNAVIGLAKGIYKYLPDEHELIKNCTEDRRDKLARAALNQSYVKNVQAIIIITGVFERAEIRYGNRSRRYVYIEAGHAAQNVYLQATALGLGTVNIGAFYDEDVKKVLLMEDNEHPLCMMPIGRR